MRSLPLLSTAEYRGLIRQLRNWCKAEHGRGKDLALQLAVSPQLVSDWISGHRTVSLDEYFQIQAIVEQSAGGQFLKDNSMTTFPNMTQTRPPVVRNSAIPRTLASALEALEERDAVIAELRSQIKSTSPSPAASAPTPPAAPKVPATPPPTTITSSTGMVFNPENPLTEIDRLRVALNQAASEEQKGIIYRRIKALEAEQSGPRPVARLRGA